MSAELIREKAEIEARYGEWTTAIDFPFEKVESRPARDVFTLVERLAEVCNRTVIIGTHISLSSSKQFEHKGKLYSGSDYVEPNYDAVATGNAAWSAIGNPVSFWPDRVSLLNMPYDCGFSSVLTCNLPGGARVEAVCLAAIKGGNSVAPPLRFSKGDLRPPFGLAIHLKRKLVNLHHRLSRYP